MGYSIALFAFVFVEFYVASECLSAIGFTALMPYTAALSASALSVRSQVKFSPSRPKCP
jgi:hypothetical protein